MVGFIRRFFKKEKDGDKAKKTRNKSEGATLSHDNLNLKRKNYASHTHFGEKEIAESAIMPKPKWDPRIDIVVIGRDEGFKEFIKELWWEDEDIKDVYKKVPFRWVQLNENDEEDQNKYDEQDHKKLNFWFLPILEEKNQIARFIEDSKNIPVIFLLCAYSKEDVAHLEQIIDLSGLDCLVQVEKYQDGASSKGVYDVTDLRSDLDMHDKDIKNAVKNTPYKMVDLTEVVEHQDKEKLALDILNKSEKALHKIEMMKKEFKHRQKEYAAYCKTVEKNSPVEVESYRRGSSIYGSK